MNSKKKSINNIIATLKSFNESKVTFYLPANEIDIIRFENLIKRTLPLDYKFFLKITNGLSVDHNCIFGIYDSKNSNNMANTSLEEVYAFEHFDSCNPMPDYVVPFCPDGYGNHYCFDLLKNNIVFWEWDCDYSEGKPEVVYNYLDELLNEIFIEWTLDIG